MSVSSPKQRYEAFQEWYRWASNKYSSLRTKKKPQQETFYKKEP
jgi:hypothetical protein